MASEAFSQQTSKAVSEQTLHRCLSLGSDSMLTKSQGNLTMPMPLKAGHGHADEMSAQTIGVSCVGARLVHLRFSKPESRVLATSVAFKSRFCVRYAEPAQLLRMALRQRLSLQHLVSLEKKTIQT